MPNNIFKLEIKLKQHTPIIHFHHDQEGATLRATEMKPKLDKFIIDKLGGITYIRQNHSDWLASANHNALDYKISITPIGKANMYAISSNPDSRRHDENRKENLLSNISAEYINRTQYFGDNQYIDYPDEHSKIRRGVLYDQLIIKLSTYNSEIIRKIEAVFPAFIVSENFGTRQTKGFGCFSVLEMNDFQITECLKLNLSFTGVFKVNRTGSFQEKLQFVSDHYSRLKRGSSFKNYQKSKLWNYLCANGDLKWEKRKIKLFIKEQNNSLFDRLKYDDRSHSTHRIDDCDHSTSEKYFYIRALLGLAENYEFMLENSNSKQKVKIEDKLKRDPTRDRYAIDRFKSPIRYFISNNSIFLITQEINSLLHTYIDETNVPHSREFQFTIEGMSGNNKFVLPVPDNFDLVDFIKRSGNFGNNLK